LREVGSDYQPWREMMYDPDGEWVSYDDIAPMLAALSICAWAQVWAQGWEWSQRGNGWSNVDHRAILPYGDDFIATNGWDWNTDSIAATPVECARLAGWLDFPGAAQ